MGKWFNLTNIFQRGWNHQPVRHCMLHHYCVKTHHLQALRLCFNALWTCSSLIEPFHTFSTYQVGTPHTSKNCWEARRVPSSPKKTAGYQKYPSIIWSRRYMRFSKTSFLASMGVNYVQLPYRISTGWFPSNKYGILTTTSMRSPGMLGDFQPYKFNKITAGTCQVLEGFFEWKDHRETRWCTVTTCKANNIRQQIQDVKEVNTLRGRRKTVLLTPSTVGLLFT